MTSGPPLESAHAQTWPDRPIRFVVSQAAGSGPDISARFIAEQCGDDTALLAEVHSLLDFHEDEDEAEGEGEGGADDDHGYRGAEPAEGAARPAYAAPPTPGSASRRDPTAGDVLAQRYRMIARIGRGGMGDVWRADDLVLGTPVALKLIHSAGTEARRQIIHEVRLARQITHPAVCRVFDVGEDQGRVFLSMELVEGEDLATLLKHAGRLPSEKVVDIARQLCEGLAAAHARGVLHRDLKPANVLVDNDGRVRITDFGIAVTQHDSRRPALVGTPAYMAPEQLKPGARLSECTDLYALGLILYELLTGEHPFDRTPGARTVPPAPSTRVPSVDPALDRAIVQTLEPDPEDRPGSVAELAALLPAPLTARPRSSTPWLMAGVAAALLREHDLVQLHLPEPESAVLAGLDVWTPEEKAALEGFRHHDLANWRKIAVGEIRGLRL